MPHTLLKPIILKPIINAMTDDQPDSYQSDSHQSDLLQQTLSISETEQAKHKSDDEFDDTVLNLSDYLSAVSMVLSHTFNHKVWVKAEIRNLSSKSGHYYFELAEKSDDGSVVASCRATLWRYQASGVLDKFRHATGSELTANLSVMLKVAANFHRLYGFSLNIDDIDPNYTLGDLARQYTAMIERLDNENLLHANQKIPKPFDIQHVLVIAPQDAAGLGDFRKESDLLEQHGVCQFHYYHATFQGNHAPKEIQEAITLAFRQLTSRPDVVVIIRGGGSVGDLAYLNDYELAVLVAKLPVPVWVGIGHARDRVILDDVAQRRFDTPSKVITGIINQLQTITNQAQQAFINIQTTANRLTSLAHTLNHTQMMHIKSASMQQTAIAKTQCVSYLQLVKRQSHVAIHQVHQRCDAHINQVKQHAFYDLKSTSNQADQQLLQVKQSAYWQLATAKKQTQHQQQMILTQHPKRVLEKGYVLIKDHHGKAISTVKNLNLGQQIQLEFKDGQANATIISPS